VGVNGAMTEIHIVVIVRLETSPRHQYLSSDGHVRTDHVIDGSDALRKTSVGAAKDPVAFEGNPPWSRFFVSRDRRSAYGHDGRVLVMAREAKKPLRGCRRVVIEKRQNVARREFGRGRSRTTKMIVKPVTHYLERPRHLRVQVRKFGDATFVEIDIVVDAQEHFERRHLLAND
jgi:hypothetical protein